MASLNKVLIIGHLGADPETRFTAGGDAVANFSVATTESWKDKASGEKKELTEWHRCSVFGKLAEICGEYLKKGSLVCVEGKLQTRKWQDKDNVDRYTTEIRVNEMRMLGSKPQGDSATSEKPQELNAQGGPKPSFEDMGDDIPFLAHGAGKAWRVI